MNVMLQDLPAFRVAAVRNVGPYPTVGRAFETLHAWVARHPEIHGPGTLWFAAFHDCPRETPPENCRADACVTLPDGVSAADGVEERTFAAGRFATRLVALPPEIGGELAARWGELAEWIGANGLAPKDRSGYPCYEVYYNHPAVCPMRKWVVDLCAPVSPS